MFYVAEQNTHLSQTTLKKRDWSRYAALPLLIALLFILTQALFIAHFDTAELGDVEVVEHLDLQESGSATRQIIIISCTLAAIAGIIVQSRAGKFNAVYLWPLLIFAAYCFMSILWSPALLISFKRCIQFLCLIAIALFAIQAENPVKTILRVLQISLAITLVLNLIVVLVNPGMGITPESGAWRGFVQHKNSLGAITFMTLAVWFPEILSATKRWIRYAAIILSLLCLFMAIKSDSQTAIMIGFLVMGTWAFIKFPLPLYLKVIGMGILITGSLLWYINFELVSYSHLFSDVTDRSSDLTGRTHLWAAVIDEISRHPWFGLGYNSFWTTTIIDADWQPVQAHNGYLDIINELGFIGFGIFAVILIATIIRGYILTIKQPEFYLPLLLLLISLVVQNFTESNFCRAMTTGWFLLIILNIVFYQKNPAGRSRSTTEMVE